MNTQEGSKSTGTYYDGISGLYTLEHVAEAQELGDSSCLQSEPNYAEMCISIPSGDSCGCSPGTNTDRLNGETRA